MGIELIHITPDAIRLIEKYAKMCNGVKISKSYANSCRCVMRLMRRGHLSVLRCVQAIFKVKCSRSCSHQLVRTAHMGFIQESQRYMIQDDDFILPQLNYIDEIDRDIIRDSMEYICKTTHGNYMADIHNGIRREDARYILPNASATNIMISGNLQAWYNFIKLRMHDSAQDEIRQIAWQIAYILCEELPVIFLPLMDTIEALYAIQSFIHTRNSDDLHDMIKLINTAKDLNKEEYRDLIRRTI